MSENTRDIDYYYKKNRFLNLLLTTKKYKDLFKSKEALISFILSVLILTLMSFLLVDFTGSDRLTLTENRVTDFIDAIRPLILAVLGGEFALLGLVISGLALLTGTIGTEVITKIRGDAKLDNLMSVIYNFYFCGAIIGITSILCILTYLITYLRIEFNWYVFYGWGLFYSYFVVFSIIYSIMLLGTCIRLFLLKYFYSTKDS